jgi:hypothetical protein
MGHYMHSVPGRLRVKIPHLRNNASKCKSATTMLLNLEGVREVEANCLTGSLVVRYDERLTDVDCIITALEDNHHFESQEAADTGQYIQKAAVKAGESVGKAVFSWAAGRALERGAFGLLAAIL